MTLRSHWSSSLPWSVFCSAPSSWRVIILFPLTFLNVIDPSGARVTSMPSFFACLSTFASVFGGLIEREDVELRHRSRRYRTSVSTYVSLRFLSLVIAHTAA
jgi:hypothetical protein